MNKSIFRFLVIFGISLFFQHSILSQDLTGQWKWKNDQMETDVYFTDDMYFMEAFVQGTTSQISEGFSYYTTVGDTLIFNKVPISQGREPVAYHLITSYSPDKMQLVDLKNGKKNRYFRVNYDRHNISKYRNNEFYYGSGTIVCISDKLDNNDSHCLNFGSFSVNSTLEEIAEVLGNPYNQMKHGEKLYNIYLLEVLEDGTQPYFAIELNNNQIKSIQITGNNSVEDFSFSSVSLGDYYTFVEQKLGPPSDTGPVDDETVYWDYATFSFEIKNNFVYSIKLIKQTE